MPLVFRSTLDDSDFQRGIRNMDRGAERFSTRFIGMGKAFAASFIGGGVIAGLNRMVDSLSEINDQAAALGLNTDAFQQMGRFFSVNGAKQEDFTRGFSAFIQKVEEARQKGGQAAAAFEKLGISQRDLDNNDLLTLWQQMSDGLAKSNGGAREFSAAADILGSRLITKLAPGLAQGSEGMQRFARDAKIVSQNALEAADAVGDMRDEFYKDVSARFANQGFTLGANIQQGVKNMEGLFGKDSFLAKLTGIVGGAADTMVTGGAFTFQNVPIPDTFDPRASLARKAAERASQQASVADRKQAEMDKVKEQDQTFLNKLLKEEADTRERIERAYQNAAETRHESFLDELDGYDRVNELESDRLRLIERQKTASEEEFALIEEQLSKLDDRIAKEKAITGEKNKRSAIPESIDPGRLPPSLTRIYPAEERRAMREQELASRRIGTNTLLTEQDELARTRGDFDKAFGSRGRGGKPILGPFRPGEEPPPRGMRARDRDRQRLENKLRATIDEGDMDKFAGKVAASVDKLIAK